MARPKEQAYLFTVLLKEPQLKALIELHLFVLPEFVGMRVRRAHGCELRAHGARRAAVAGPGGFPAAAAAAAGLRKRSLRRFQSL